MPYFFFSSRRRHTRYIGDWSSDVCSSDLFSFLAGFLSEQKSYAMKQQPFSIYCEKFRLAAARPRCARASLVLVRGAPPLFLSLPYLFPKYVAINQLFPHASFTPAARSP